MVTEIELFLKIDPDFLLFNSWQFRKNTKEFSFINNRCYRFDDFQGFIDVRISCSHNPALLFHFFVPSCFLPEGIACYRSCPFFFAGYTGKMIGGKIIRYFLPLEVISLRMQEISKTRSPSCKIPDASIHVAMYRCGRAASRRSDEMRFFNQRWRRAPGGTIIPGEYLFRKPDKPDEDLQFLLFFWCRDDPIQQERKYIRFIKDRC